MFWYNQNPAGAIIKCKVHIWLRGDPMINDSNSYAQVLQWSIIWLFIVLAIHMAWIMISVDWVNTFPQAVLAKTLFMQTPRGFLNKYGTNRCLKLTHLFVDQSLHLRIGITIFAKHYWNLVYRSVHLTSVCSINQIYYWCYILKMLGLVFLLGRMSKTCWTIATGRIQSGNWRRFCWILRH